MASRSPSNLHALFAAALCAAALAPAAAAWAAPESLREGLFGHRGMEGRRMAAPPVARYVSEEEEAFVLDRTRPKALMKFESSIEIWALQPQPAPRGDTIYKNDIGEPVLRATRLGGLTVFTEARPGGSAAALSGPGSPIRLPPLGVLALGERLVLASARASQAARKGIEFSAEATPRSAAIIADAAMVTAEAVAHIARRADARRVLARISRVQLEEGTTASADLERGVMRITVVPTDGPAGRPSSKRIIAEAAR